MLQKIIDQINEKWSNYKIDYSKMGYMIQPCSKFLSYGYSINEISDMEKKNNLLLNSDFVNLISLTKGINKPQINTSTNEKRQRWFNRDIELIELNNDFKEFNLQKDDVLVRIYSHRFILCNRKKRIKDSKVFSVVGDDIIIFSNSIEDYLIKEFL